MYILHLVEKKRYPFIDDAIDQYLWDWSDYALSGLLFVRISIHRALPYAVDCKAFSLIS